MSCEYCNAGDENKKIYDRGGKEVYITNYNYSMATLDIAVCYNLYGLLETAIEINYCPICGRELEME